VSKLALRGGASVTLAIDLSGYLMVSSNQSAGNNFSSSGMFFSFFHGLSSE